MKRKPLLPNLKHQSLMVQIASGKHKGFIFLMTPIAYEEATTVSVVGVKSSRRSRSLARDTTMVKITAVVFKRVTRTLNAKRAVDA